jgi:spore coat polysaccharide biosynthesis protein SpsF
MTAVVLQARLDSSRLPHKALFPLDGEPILLRVMEALKGVVCDKHILACPQDSEAIFAPIAERLGFALVHGSKENVLQRYCDVIRKFGIDRVIRATGDNPFVFADAAVAINEEAVGLGADYAGYSGLPYGAGVESITADSLFLAEKEARLPPEKEHVCPYLYNHPEKFRLHRPLAPCVWQAPEIRVTIDTAEDYERAKILYGALNKLPSDEKHRGETIINTFRQVL